MKSTGILLLSFVLHSISGYSQEFILHCNKWMDMNQKTNRSAPSTIYIDSSTITIEQGESHLYLEIKTRKRDENVFAYSVLDFNDVVCMAVFQPEEMIFDYRSKEFWLRYNIESIDRPNQDTADSTITDSIAAEELIHKATIAKIMVVRFIIRF